MIRKSVTMRSVIRLVISLVRLGVTDGTSHIVSCALNASKCIQPKKSQNSTFSKLVPAPHSSLWPSRPTFHAESCDSLLVGGSCCFCCIRAPLSFISQGSVTLSAMLPSSRRPIEYQGFLLQRFFSEHKIDSRDDNGGGSWEKDKQKINSSFHNPHRYSLCITKSISC